MEAVDGLVWYVAYGSNVSTARFQRYLDDCPDPTPARRSVAGVLRHRLFFAYSSRQWEGGGSAFVDPADTGAETLVVAHLVTEAQFLHVLAAENVAHVDALDGVELPGPGETRVALPGRYGLVVGAESTDERPAYTFTTSADPLPAPTLPSVRYLDTIAEGLRQHHGLADADARRYLAAHGGVS